MDGLTLKRRTGRRIDFLLAALDANTDDCIPWPFAVRKSSGYGAHNAYNSGKKRSVDAHSFMCWAVHGDAPAGLPQALHSCDNRLCVNPRHLSWGSHAQNMVQMSERGRAAVGGQGAHKRIPESVRRGVLASSSGLVATALEFGIMPRTAAAIRKRGY